jgi:hypothetical protein
MTDESQCRIIDATVARDGVPKLLEKPSRQLDVREQERQDSPTASLLYPQQDKPHAAGGPQCVPVYYHSPVQLFSTRKRLNATHDRLVRARQDLVVLDEQLGALAVDEEGDGHERHIERLRAERVRLAGQIAELEKAQDALLDRL